ncbi:MAG: hypothetical protein ACKVPJ_03625 [Chitinophagales bacterium]
MKKNFFLVFILFPFISLTAQTIVEYSQIPKEMIQAGPEGGSRAGSCDSPNGDIVCDDLTGYPTSSYLSSNSCCYTISPAVKNATYCWEFIAGSSSIILDSGWGITTTGGFSSWFSTFELYTCTPDCSLVGTGLSYSGLTPGACYTWCFNTHMTGGGSSGGFTFLCPYVILTGTLAVTYSSFDCMSGQENIQLSWSTSSETNCEAFHVMRSGDGINYEQIASIQGHGSTTQSHAYLFNDENPLPGENYYYLEQVDFGNTSVSTTSVIVCKTDDPLLTLIYYNLMGEKIDFDAVPAGVYIKETVTSTKKTRQLMYKS